MFTAVRKKQKGNQLLLVPLCLCCGILLICYSASIKSGIVRGLQLSAGVLIPSLFPFMVLSSFFVNSKAYLVLQKPLGFLSRSLFRLPAYTAGVILMSMVGGYPVGAKMIRLLLEQGKLSEKQAQSMLCFCFGSGPAFSIGIVGIGVFSSARAGVILFLAHILASLFTGMIFAQRTPPIEYTEGESGDGDSAGALVDAVSGSTSAMISITAFVVLFCGVLAIVDETGLFAALDAFFPALMGGKLSSSLLPGVFEVTGGCIGLSAHTHSSLLLAAFYLSFGGFCVHAQVFGLLQGYRLSYPKFLLSRVCCAVLSALITALLLKIFPLSLPTSHLAGQPAVSFFSVSPLSSFFFLLLVCSFICQTAAKAEKGKTFS